MKVRTKVRVLIVDDEPAERNAVEVLLGDRGYEAESVGSGPAGVARVEERTPDVVLADLHMPGMDGIEMLSAMHVRCPGLPVIFVTGSSLVSSAVRAMRAGAAHYLTKPVDIDELSLAIDRAIENRDVRSEAENLRTLLKEQAARGLDDILGSSPPMQRLYKVATQVAPSRATVLITGESGTGKGQLARALHTHSARGDHPFVGLHCAALAESILESELFGHEKGSFTGADRRRIGRFEQAHGGTLFLDEIGEIPATIQLKLLRVLQEKTFERVGGNDEIKVDVRLIAATNRDLEAEVASGRFREDLYYRLNVVHIEMPPLRTRGQDIIALAEHFLQKFAKENEKTIRGFSDAAIAKLLAHRWPGNVRELENLIERAVVLAEGSKIDASDLPLVVAQGKHGIQLPGATLAEVERHAILTTLAAVDGSTSRAADILGISPRMIQYRLREYGMAQPRGRRPTRHAMSS